MAVQMKDALVGARPAAARARGFVPRRLFGRDWAAAWLFLAPCMLVIIGLIAYPFVWLFLLPFRIVGIAVHGALALVAGVILLPFRLLSAPFRIAGI